MVLREGAEALEGGGPETCEGRDECLAEECAECMVAEWGSAKEISPAKFSKSAESRS